MTTEEELVMTVPHILAQSCRQQLQGVKTFVRCHLERTMKQLVAAPPLSLVESEEFHLERTPKTHGYIYRGVAIR